uniref:Uncharacterized protein n=1 Tax=Oryza meridionalis TaxID=40149 RepID=A0A0E0DYP4_9ORYZ
MGAGDMEHRQSHGDGGWWWIGTKEAMRFSPKTPSALAAREGEYGIFENNVTEKLDGPFSNIVGMKNTWKKTKPVGPWENKKKRNGNLSRGECDIYDA